MADKKGGPATDKIMSPADMKPLLVISKREPVNAVIGMTKDHEGVILLSRKIKPKTLLAQLKADARKSKIELDTTSLRFGKAKVDADRDSGLVMFTVNKDVPGALRMKLLEVVKRVPYSKVEIDVDAKFETEPEEDDEQAGMSQAASQAAPAAPAGAPADQPDASMEDPEPTKRTDEVLYGTETGDTAEITDEDIHQGRLGDCYLLSSIGEIARINPSVIENMIKDNGDGTYTVTFHKRRGASGVLIAGLFGVAGVLYEAVKGQFETVTETVDGNFPKGTGNNKGSANQYGGQDMVGSKAEIWVQVIEKAYAKLHGGYAEIGGGGWANDALEELTGQEAEQDTVGKVTLADLQAAFQAGKPIVMNTPDKPSLPYNLVGDHAYMLENLEVHGTTATVTLRNPWGYNPPSTNNPFVKIPFDKLSSGIDSIDIGGSLANARPAPEQADAAR
jgi:Calpain family cysteine protease